MCFVEKIKNKEMKNKAILNLLFLTILSPIILGWCQETFHSSLLASVFSLVDELFVLFLLVLTLVTKKTKCNKKTALLIIALWIIGLLSGANSKFNLLINLLGGFNVCKSMILYWCLCQYFFTNNEIDNFVKKITQLLPFIFVTYIIEFFFTGFRPFLGFETQGLQYRNGLRCFGGIFSRFTYASLFGLLYYIIYTRFCLLKTSTKKSYFGIFMVTATLKIKDIFGIIIVYICSKFKKIKAIYIIPIFVMVISLTSAYEFFFPEHYNTYFGEDADGAVRNIMTYTGIKIVRDYFPLGVGWGKFGSATSAQYVSEIYQTYGIEGLWGLDYDGNHSFMQDTQWPMFLGETGFLGTFVFLTILYVAFSPYLKTFFNNTKDKISAIPAMLFIYFIVVSIGKPVFVAVPHSYVLWGFAGIFYNNIKNIQNK